MWVERPRLTHTTSQEPLFPRGSHHHWHLLCTRAPDIATQQRKHIGASPPYGEDTPDRRQVQRKEKGGGTSAKSSVLMLICVPLPHLVLPLSGCACSGTPTMATRGEARDTHGSGSAAITGVPLPQQRRKFDDGPVMVKALRLVRQPGSSFVNGVSP